MNDKIKRIGLIVFMLAVLIYTIVNYINHKIDMTYLIVIFAFLGFLLMGQIAALIREWNDD